MKRSISLLVYADPSMRTSAFSPDMSYQLWRDLTLDGDLKQRREDKVEGSSVQYEPFLDEYEPLKDTQAPMHDTQSGVTKIGEVVRGELEKIDASAKQCFTHLVSEIDFSASVLENPSADFKAVEKEVNQKQKDISDKKMEYCHEESKPQPNREILDDLTLSITEIEAQLKNIVGDTEYGKQKNIMNGATKMRAWGGTQTLSRTL